MYCTNKTEKKGNKTELNRKKNRTKQSQKEQNSAK